MNKPRRERESETERASERAGAAEAPTSLARMQADAQCSKMAGLPCLIHPWWWRPQTVQPSARASIPVSIVAPCSAPPLFPRPRPAQQKNIQAQVPKARGAGRRRYSWAWCISRGHAKVGARTGSLGASDTCTLLGTTYTSTSWRRETVSTRKHATASLAFVAHRGERRAEQSRGWQRLPIFSASQQMVPYRVVAATGLPGGGTEKTTFFAAAITMLSEVWPSGPQGLTRGHTHCHRRQQREQSSSEHSTNLTLPFSWSADAYPSLLHLLVTIIYERNFRIVQ